MQQFAEQAQANKEKRQISIRVMIINRQHHSKDFVRVRRVSGQKGDMIKNLTAEDQPWNHKAGKVALLKGIN